MPQPTHLVNDVDLAGAHSHVAGQVGGVAGVVARHGGLGVIGRQSRPYRLAGGAYGQAGRQGR